MIEFFYTEVCNRSRFCAVYFLHTSFEVQLPRRNYDLANWSSLGHCNARTVRIACMRSRRPAVRWRCAPRQESYPEQGARHTDARDGSNRDRV